MEIYLLRHAIAADSSLAGFMRDDERPLTEDGEARMCLAAKGMGKMGLEFDRIFSSPLLRAKQTAQIVAETLGCPERVEIDNRLGHGFSSQAIFDLLNQGRDDDRILLVGHQPDMGELASRLLSREGFVRLDVKKGSLCCIETYGGVADGTGSLIWHLAPKHLRAIGSKK